MSGDSYYPKKRFMPVDPNRQVELPYDIGTATIDDIVARNPKLVDVMTLNLTSAQVQPKEINTQGWACVIFGHDGTQTRVVNTTAFVACQFNQFDPSIVDLLQSPPTPFGYPLKHARGFYGPFNKLYLTWPAQTGVYADLVIYKSCLRPWIDGETPT